MDSLDTLYTEFKEALKSETTFPLERFLKKGFWDTLAPDERVELARLCLKRAEASVLDEEATLTSLVLAEEIGGASDEVLHTSTKILFELGQITQKKHYFLLASSRLKEWQKNNPLPFKQQEELWILWGDIFLALGNLGGKAICFEKALTKYERARKFSKQNHTLFWSLAETWMGLFAFSQEIGDFQQGVKAFSQAARLGCNLPRFWLEYGEAVLKGAKRFGMAPLTERAATLFKKAMQLSNSHEALQKRAFEAYARCYALLYVLTGAKETFSQAVLLLQVTGQIREENALYLQRALFTRSGEAILMALEGIKRENLPHQLAPALALLGHACDDFLLLKGAVRLLEAVPKKEQKNPTFLFAKGVVEHCLGEYFEDVRYFFSALALLKKAHLMALGDVNTLFYLTSTYFYTGTLQGELSYFQEGFKYIKRACELCPLHPKLWQLWGEGLFLAATLESDLEEALIREAIEKLSYVAKDNPDWGALFYLGLSLDHLGLLTGVEAYHRLAIQYLTPLYESNEDNVDICYGLARCWMHVGEVTRSLAPLKKAAALFEEVVKKDVEHHLAHCDLGYTLLNMAVWGAPINDLYSRAEKALLTAARFGSCEVYYHLACLYALNNREELAIEFLKKADHAKLLPNLDDIEYDEWLDPIKKSIAFKAFIEKKREEDH